MLQNLPFGALGPPEAHGPRFSAPGHTALAFEPAINFVLQKWPNGALGPPEAHGPRISASGPPGSGLLNRYYLWMAKMATWSTGGYGGPRDPIFRLRATWPRPYNPFASLYCKESYKNVKHEIG